MPDYLEYQKSIAQEFKSYENRVRNLIDDASWAEEGRFKEIILMNYLKRIVPKNVSVGTGFVRNNDGEITRQVDIIVYDNTYPLLFSEGDFVICTGESVFGIIEVKTAIQASSILDIIDKASNNGRIIIDGWGSREIFNGIFSYNVTGNIGNFYQYIGKVRLGVNRDIGCTMVNNIALGNKYFLNLLNKSEYLQKTDGYISYDVYEMNNHNEGLAFAYFFSYLLEIIYKRSSHFVGRLPKEFEKLLFPIDEMVCKIYEVKVDIK